MKRPRQSLEQIFDAHLCILATTLRPNLACLEARGLLVPSELQGLACLSSATLSVQILALLG